MSSKDHSPLDYTDKGTGLVAPAIVLAFAATLVTMARFWARRLTRQSFGLDEWLCLAALIAQHVFLAACGVSVFQGGMGRDIRISAIEDPESLVVLSKSIIVTNVAWTLGSPLIKLSVLAFYWRLFPTQTVRLGCKLLTVLCIAWLIVVIIINSIGCWDNVIGPKSHCLSGSLVSMDIVVIPSTANCVIDFLTLILPIQEIYRLKISSKQKLKIGGVFLLGGMACAASVVRTVALGNYYKEDGSNFTQQFVVAGFAALVEIYVAIIGACLPILRPVCLRLRHFGKRRKDYPAPKDAESDGRVGKITLDKKNQRVAGQSMETLDDPFDDDGFTLGAYPGHHRVHIRSNERNDMP